VSEHLGVDPRLLASFVVLGEELHFTRAAERLHIAQPALSQQIARLELQLGATLFTRAPVGLTPAGAALFERAQPAFRALRAAVETARRVGNGDAGPVRLGHLSSFGPRAIPALVAALRDRLPDLELVAGEYSVEEQLAGLHAGALDVGLLYHDPTVELGDPAVTLHPIASGPHYVVLPAAHPLAGRTTLALEELAEEQWIEPRGTGTPGYQARFFHGLCARHGFTPSVAAHANSIETMLGMVGAGLGVAPAPWIVRLRPPSPELVFVETPGETFDVVAAVLAGGRAAAVIEIARDVLGELALSAVRTAR
jgi:DNA-binding transcriptional LysR family regulator